MATIVSISSHVARGHVGNSAAAFALQRMGHTVWPVPSVVMAHHPGHGPVRPVAIAADNLAAVLDDLTEARWLAEVDAVLSGYLVTADQAPPIARFVEQVKAANPRALYVCDPILGDAGTLYVSEAVAAAQRDLLVPRADLVTPNLYELSWLCGEKLSDNMAALAAVRRLGPARALVTSANAMLRDGAANLLVTPAQAWLAETRRLDGVPHGTGDLMTALFLGHLLDGKRDEAALEKATASLFEILVRTLRRGRDELTLVDDQDRLLGAATPVRLSRLGTAAPRRPGSH